MLLCSEDEQNNVVI